MAAAASTTRVLSPRPPLKPDALALEAYGQLAQRAYATAPPPTYTFGPVVRLLVVKGAEAPGGCTTLAFPGTRPEDVQDDLADAELGPLAVEGGALVHRGFWIAALQALPTVVRLASAPPDAAPLELVGHRWG